MRLKNVKRKDINKINQREIQKNTLTNIFTSSAYLTIGVFISFMSFLWLFQSIGKYWVFLVLIFLYYINFFYEHGFNKNTVKSIFFNFLGVVALYNILLTFNILGMVEVSSNYLVSNIFYFYIAFLIISCDFKFYNKVMYIINVYFGFMIKNEKNILMPMFFLMINTVILALLTIFIAEGMELSQKNIITIVVIILLISTLIFNFCFMINKKYIQIKINPEEVYAKIKTKIEKLENPINEFTAWFIEIFKMEKRDGLDIITHNGNIKYINTIGLILTKIVPFMVMILLLNTNVYYSMYYQERKGLCQNINNNINIIELKNSKVLIQYENNNIHYYKEYDCIVDYNKIKLKI